MVKIKEGYVMSQREQAEFDRVNALPRKLTGRADYYFKPQTKYPPRIYVFMHAEIWCDRNRRPMGLFYAVPFLSRPMNREEIEYHHFNHRLCYHQYEDWAKLIYAEEQEAEELDNELPGTGTSFLNSLKGFKKKYPLAPQAIKTAVKIPEKIDEGISQYIRDLISKGAELTAEEISGMLRIEQEGEKRLAVLILLRELYKNVVKEEKDKGSINENMLNRKVMLSKERTQRNFVRRVYRHNKLFALEEIRRRYPDYEESMLFNDIRIKNSKIKSKKCKPVLELRRCQLEKLAFKLKNEDLPEKEYQLICNKISMLQHAHNCRLPIPLLVKINDITSVYSFGWRTRESVVKSFVSLANMNGTTHELLAAKHEEMVSSSYSY